MRELSASVADLVHWRRTAHCVRTVSALYEKYAILDPFSPMAKVTTNNYCVPIHGIAQILAQSENSDNELQQSVSPTENPRLLAKSAVLAPWT
jgi:hypothetical protein